MSSFKQNCLSGSISPSINNSNFSNKLLEYNNMQNLKQSPINSTTKLNETEITLDNYFSSMIKNI